jgi:hypothetical protein
LKSLLDLLTHPFQLLRAASVASTGVGIVSALAGRGR